MKKLYQIIGIFLVALMIFPFWGCGKLGSKLDIAGKWVYECDCTDLFLEQLGKDVDIDIDAELIYTLVLDLDDDGTFELYFDEDKITDSIESIMSELTDAAADMIYEELEKQGYSKDQADADFYTAYGKDVKSYAEEMVSSYADYDALEKKIRELTLEGYYKVEDDILLLSEDEDDFDDAEEWEFKLKEDQLTIRSIENQNKAFAEEFEKREFEFPMKFER